MTEPTVEGPQTPGDPSGPTGDSDTPGGIRSGRVSGGSGRVGGGSGRVGGGNEGDAAAVIRQTDPMQAGAAEAPTTVAATSGTAEPGKAASGRPRRVGPVPLINPANALTAARLVMVPVFVVLVVASDMTDPTLRIVACVVFCVASVTDLADGWIARTFDLVTSFGKVADPIADKALTGAAFILLSVYGSLDWWITVVILGREVGVTLLRFWVIRRGVIAASRGGKIKTSLQSLAIFWYLLPFPPALAQVGPYLIGITVAVTVITGLDYVARAMRLHRSPSPAA